MLNSLSQPLSGRGEHQGVLPPRGHPLHDHPARVRPVQRRALPGRRQRQRRLHRPTGSQQRGLRPRLPQGPLRSTGPRLRQLQVLPDAQIGEQHAVRRPAADGLRQSRVGRERKRADSVQVRGRRLVAARGRESESGVGLSSELQPPNGARRKRLSSKST